MKVYIAAPYELKDAAKVLRDQLFVDADIECTSGWIDASNLPSADEAMIDLADVHRADALVLINPLDFKNKGTGGRHFECGFAYALNIPIIVFGEKTNIFHELVTHVVTVDGVLAALREL